MQKISYEEFLTSPDTPVFAEWVDGAVVPLSPQSAPHQDLSRFLCAIVSHFVEAHRLGVVLPAPFQMKSRPELPGREPDLLFVAEERRERIRRNHVDGPADLAVEIVSRDSRRRDRIEKLREYERGGVGEYWLIDPLVERATFYRLEGDRYAPMPVHDAGLFHSRVLDGLWLRVDWLWRQPPPRIMDVIREWGLV